MYLDFGVDNRSVDNTFSFAIAKNPHGEPFKRKLGGSDGDRVVVGSFLHGSEQSYQVVVRNDEPFIMKGLRDKNLSFYVTSKAFAVSPFNLQGLRTALRSALTGTNPSPEAISDEQFREDRDLYMHLGPFALPFSVVSPVFEAAGFVVVDATPHDTSEACMVTLTQRTSITTFLQKVLVLSTFLTAKQDDQKYLEDERIKSLMVASKDWLAAMGEQWVDRITHRISGGHKGLKAQFIATLEPSESPAPVESASEDGMATEIVEKSKSLHQQRHAIIVDNVPDSYVTVVELGCGNGKLLGLLAIERPNAILHGIDAEEWDLRVVRRRAPKATVYLDNITSPYVESSLLRPDVLILTEVIEHLERHDRQKLIYQIVNMWHAKSVIITVPNVAYNEVLGLEPGQYRHDDHKIEYTLEQFQREVVEPLEADYVCELEKMISTEEHGMQPSFVLVATRRPDPKHLVPDMGLLYAARDLHAPYHIEEVGYTVTSGEMQVGITHRAYRGNRHRIPFLSPTMAPVDYDPKQPGFLEYPEAAFDYYEQRGVVVLAEQKKMMGSRAHVIVFKNHDTAVGMGFDTPAYAVSRGGYPFFDDDETLLAIWGAISPKMESDMIVLDCEVLPWSLKAGRGDRSLISKQFRAPGEAALLFKDAVGDDTTNAQLFLRALDEYAKDGPTELHVFGVLATADVEKGKYVRVILGDLAPVADQTAYLNHLLDGAPPIVKVVQTERVAVTSKESKAESVQRWLDYTANGGEGFVYKPMWPGSMPDGYPVQPALKVRGQDYLRLIYGYDYLSPQTFRQLQKRGTGAKRRLAIQEAVLSRRILMAFLRDHHVAHGRALAAFLGMDGVTSAKIDVTL